MIPASVRLGAYLLGLLSLRGLEAVSADHAPTTPRLSRWVSNLSLGAMNGVVISLVCTTCFLLTTRGLFPFRFAPLAALELSPWARLLLEVLILDLLAYLLHWSYHAVPLLWRFHLVHHSDLDLDVSSASRFHLGEVVVSSVVKLAVVGLLGISPAGLVLFEVVMVACAQFQHANLRLPSRVDGVLWWTLVPPAMHRIHHTPVREDTDSNYGTILTFWDRAFRTLRRGDPAPDPSFGVPELRHPLSLPRLLALPFR
ncbi:MAG: sterol desaturase family protein [Acidobacteria bacterium]|nr:sterol desaturase family protein [Acidobacteriota bacterium]